VSQGEGWLKSFDGTDLFYREWVSGKKIASALVFVHGLGDHSGRHPHLVEAFTDQPIGLYALDLRGHGRSSGQRGFIRRWLEYREDVAAFVRLVGRENPDKPLFLMGHSLGGFVVLEYALHHADGLRGVIASSPAIGEATVPAWKMALALLLSRLWPRFAMKQSWDQAISRDEEVVKSSKEDPLTHSWGSAGLAAEYTKALEWTLSHAEDFRLPLLMLHGTSDAVVPTRAARSFIDRVGSEDKTLKEYEGGYHELDNDVDHRRVTADLITWMESRTP
jgi:alpha-beta hydrolase superfamily lysophospholipase